MAISSNRKILLTGAGFTHNFGAPLANQLWAMIFNHWKVQACEKVRNELLKNTDFETVYYKILEGSYSDEEKKAIKVAVIDAYADIDKTIRNISYNNVSYNQGIGYQVNMVLKMIYAFAGMGLNIKELPGFLFTLNQDLFLERHHYIAHIPFLPGVENYPSGFTLPERQLGESQLYRLSSAEQIKSNLEKCLLEHDLYYIKLHGSCNWTSAIRERQMVIGLDKDEQIEEEPVLKWYLKIFEQVLNQSQCRLLSIGYGFGDKHINNPIADAVTKSGLRLYIISPSTPSEFLECLKGKHRGEEIWKGLGGFYPYSLAEMFPSDQSESNYWQNLQLQFFERRIE